MCEWWEISWVFLTIIDMSEIYEKNTSIYFLMERIINFFLRNPRSTLTVFKYLYEAMINLSWNFILNEKELRVVALMVQYVNAILFSMLI